MEVKRFQAITFLKTTVEEKLSQMQSQCKIFDANVFQLMLQKTLKELSTKQDTFNIKLPLRLIAKGLLCFCGKYVNECVKRGDDEIEHYLDFSKYDIGRSYFAFLEQTQEIVAAEFILYYTEKILLDRIATFREESYSNIDYSRYTQRVNVPWDILIFFATNNENTYFNYCDILLDYTLSEIVDLYVQSKSEDFFDKVLEDKAEKRGAYINNLIDEINGLQYPACSWKEWIDTLGKHLDCSFIPSVGDIFQVTDVSQVSEMVSCRLKLKCHGELFNYFVNIGLNDTTFKNAAGLSYVCDEVCPMCGAWCDNILESHTVHSSMLHRPRGLRGETYPVKDTVSNAFSSGSESDSQSSLSSALHGGHFVLEDCFMSITSDTATFEYEGKKRLCKKFKESFSNWDIHPGKGNVSNRLFWQHFFSQYYANVEYNIPQEWHDITIDDVLLSLKQAKEAQLNGRKSISSMPLKKRLLASCSKDS